MAAKKKKNKKKKMVKRVILGILAVLFIAGSIYAGPKAFAILRMSRIAKAFVDSSTASTFKESKTTLVYDTNGNELCKIKSSKDMYYVDFSDIPLTLDNAFVVMEDRDFYNHDGIDYKAIVRAAIVNQKSNEIAQGASTITQQLARNIFLTQEVTWQRKIEEIFIAWGLEKKYSKEQILEFYLNNIYFGNGYYGVEAAAKGYFNKSVSQLTLSEQAFIAAIPNNPSKYNPLTGFDKTLKRRDLILQQMYEADYISYVDYYMAKGENIVLNQPEQEKEDNSVVTYVRHCATESLMKSTGFSFRDNFSSKKMRKATIHCMIHIIQDASRCFLAEGILCIHHLTWICRINFSRLLTITLQDIQRCLMTEFIRCRGRLYRLIIQREMLWRLSEEEARI